MGKAKQWTRHKNEAAMSNISDLWKETLFNICNILANIYTNFKYYNISL